MLSYLLYWIMEILSIPKSHFSCDFRPIWYNFCHQFITTGSNLGKTCYQLITAKVAIMNQSSTSESLARHPLL